MNKGIIVALALSGAVLTGPAALAAPVDPAGALPGYGLEHAGHDHDHTPNPDKPKPVPHPDKRKDHHGDGDSAHAGGGYDSHRHHPRDW